MRTFLTITTTLLTGILMIPLAAYADTDKEFVSLFNGKDLAGRKGHDKSPRFWLNRML